MYKIFLSYGHSDKERASDVYRQLTELGQTVWMDEAPTDSNGPGAFLGIPAGQRHADVIQAAIAESATFLICDGRAWRDSDYCQHELRMAEDAGTRIAVLDDPDLEPLDLPAIHFPSLALSTLVEALEERVELAFAHVRLSDANRGDSQPGWWEGLFGNPERLADANLVLVEPPALDAPRSSPELLAYAQKVIGAAAAGSVRRRRVGVSILAVLTALAVLAVISGLNASRDAGIAQAQQRTAESLYLARESLAAAQPESVSLASEAWAKDHNSDTRAAMTVATADTRAYQVSKLTGVASPMQMRALSDDRFAVSEGSRIVVGTPNGPSTTIQLPDQISFAPLMQAGNSLYARRILDESSRLVRIPLDAGAEESLSQVEGVTAETQSGDTIWLATRTGEIGVYDPVGDTLQPRLRLEHTVTALAVEGSMLLALTPDAHLLKFDLGTAEPHQVADLDLSTLTAPSIPATGLDQDSDSTASQHFVLPNSTLRTTVMDRIVDCGTTTHVLVGTRTGPFREAIHVGLDASGKPMTPFTTRSGVTSFACARDGELVSTGPLSARLETYSPGQAAPGGMVSLNDRLSYTAITNTPDGEIASINGDGRLVRSTAAGASTRQLGTAAFIAPLGSDLIAQDLNGDLLSVSGSRPATRIGRLTDQLVWYLNRRDTTVVGSDQGIYLVQPGGIVRSWPRPAGLSARSLDLGGRNLLLLLPGGIELLPLDGGPPTQIPLPRLNASEELNDLAMRDNDLFASTDQGRVLRLDVASGQVVASWQSPDAPQTLIDIAAGPEPGLIVYSCDGIVRRLDRDLNTVASRFLGPMGTVLRVDVETRTVLAATQARRVVVMDGTTLEPQQSVTAADLTADAFLTGAEGQLVLVRTFLRAKTGEAPNMQPLRQQVTRTGVLPEPADGENDIDASVELFPICTDCVPR